MATDADHASQSARRVPVPSRSRKQLHDRLAIRAIECGRRLVRQDDGRVSDDGARDRHPLLFAAAEFARIRLYLVARPTFASASRDRTFAALRRSPRTSSASLTLSVGDNVGNR
jgi:hypothetical protein